MKGEGLKVKGEGLKVEGSRFEVEGRGVACNAHLKCKPTVYYVVNFGAGGDFTAPGNSHINEIITLAGGRNIGDTLSTWNVSREYLFTQNPDLIFVRTEDFPFFIKTYPYTLLKAVKENRVYPIESGWMDVISPRNFLAIEEIGGKIRGL
jgi:iron complex transport system substrate-binding protein